MKRVSVLIISLLILTACAPVVTSQSLPIVTATPHAPPEVTATFISISPSPTKTQIPCDPLTADFCISDGHFILQRPIQPPANDSVDRTYPYASTANGTRDPHHGVDMENAIGTPVYAAANGTVAFAGPDKEAIYSPWENFYGNLIVIKHADDLFTLYAHLSRIGVQMNEKVVAGQMIGEVGRTGVAIGSHLHFEVRRGGDGHDYFSTLNPELWLVPKDDASGNPLGALAVSIVDEKHQFIKYTEFTARYYLTPTSPKIKSYYLATYPLDMANDNENAALGDLASGYYRIALNVNDHVYERWVEVQSGKLTRVVFVVTTR